MALYSEKVMDHFRHPRNVGSMENADGIGEVGNAKCGDIMKIYLKIDNDIVTDVKFETFGCGSAIASSSRHSWATFTCSCGPKTQFYAMSHCHLVWELILPYNAKALF